MNEPRTPLIFLVDDDVDYLDISRQILEHGGYAVKCYHSPEAALAALREEIPGLVITDLMMSTLDAGFNFARHLRENPIWCHVPILIITAVSSQRGFDFRPHGAEDLAAMGADAFLEKPVLPKTLLRKVQELLGNSR